MSNDTTLKTLFATLHGCLPYEYDIHSTGKTTDYSITISKKDSNRTIYVTPNTHDNDDTLDLTLYDDTYGDKPLETLQQDTNITDLLTYIKKTL